jgi:hypothetical protein
VGRRHFAKRDLAHLLGSGIAAHLSTATPIPEHLGTRLEPADILLARRRSFISRAIRFFTRSLGEPRSEVSHAGIVVEGGPIEQALIVEAAGRVKKRPILSRYGKRSKKEVAFYRPLNLSPEERAVVVRAAEEYLGKDYSYFKILLHLLDWLLQGAYFFRRLGGINDYPICSWLVAQSYAKVGKTFGVAPGAASPDDIWDFVTTHPTKYAMVRALGPLVRQGLESRGVSRTAPTSALP